MNPQLHWHEGLFLYPHHLQYLQHSVYSELDAIRRLGMPKGYGVIEATVSQDELANYRLRFDVLKAMMPSGQLISANENADVFDLDLKPLFASGETQFLISLVVPTWQPKRANSFEIGAQVDPRVKLIYTPKEVSLVDENTGSNAIPFYVRRVNARLTTENEDKADLEVLPLIKITRVAGDNMGAPRIDFDFVPPSLYLESSPALYRRVRDLVNQLEASGRELGVVLTRGGFNIETIRGVQFEQLLRFRTLKRAVARLKSLLEVGRISPFAWHLEFRGLYAELSALHPEQNNPEPMLYDHDDLARTFNDIDVRLRSALRAGLGASFLRLEFKSEDSCLAATLTDEHLNRPVEYYLAIKSKSDPREIIRLVEDPDQFKFMPRSLANRAVRGMVLKEERIAPLQLPAQVGLTYFRCLRDESKRIWQQVQAEKSVVVRWPGIATDDVQVTLYMTVAD
ncbi:MAG: type VI secretion system baseplate subunit TssK [Verrucomicrobia bacterium]|nr:type VI secretion system baseplate subunit TssK [Verrucomicrobiota bacterium]